MRVLGVIFVAMASVFYIAVNLPQMRRLAQLPDPALEQEHRRLVISIAQQEQDLSTTESGSKILGQMRWNYRWTFAEWKRREFALSLWMPCFLLVGLVLVFRPLLRSLFGTSSPTDERIFSREVPEEPPREEYVDEYEFYRRSESGFKSREEAAAWLVADPMKKCDYCGTNLKPTMQGGREAVQLITFYKKVPAGAKDLRVILGTLWFANAASELKCPSCERIVRR